MGEVHTTRAVGHRGPSRANRGFTLLEVMIVIAIIGIASGVALSSLGSLTGAELRTQTNRISAAIRHAYNRSVADGMYMRMVLNIETDRYWVEGSYTPTFIPAQARSEGEANDGKTAKDKDDEDAPVVPKNDFVRIIEEVGMDKGIGIDGVITAGQEDEFKSGTAHIYFFPNGFVEPAMIYTTDGDEDYYTLIINPMTGRVRRQKGRADPSESMGRPDKVEDEER